MKVSPFVRGRRRISVAFLAVACLSAAGAQTALLDQYCRSCHSEKLKTGGVALEGMSLDHVADRASVWEKVLRKVRTGEMPPPGLPRPDAKVAAAFTSRLASELDRPAAPDTDSGRTAITRV